MKIITKIITTVTNRFKKDLPIPAGRWKTKHCDIENDIKIDLSNEDHCGTCGEYALKQIETDKIQEVKK